MNTLACIRLIADSIDYSLRGSNPEEQAQIVMIRREFAPYLYSIREDVPPEIIERLGPTAEAIVSSVKDDLSDVLDMYSI